MLRSNDQTLEEVLEQLYCLNRDRVGDHERPHKPSLILAVIDLFEKGRITENRISFSPELRQRFDDIFDIVKQADDRPTIQNPFFYLSGERFWKTYNSDGIPLYVPGNVGRAPTMGVLKESYVVLSNDLFSLLVDSRYRGQVRAALISRYFAYQAHLLLELLDCGTPLKETLKAADEKPARDAAFAKTVKELYDYRCSACGQRIVVNAVHFVDAAHIIPFSESYNDHPSNGIALCKNHHWAMDQNLLAPTPDYRWLVSSFLDGRNRDHRELLELDKQRLFLPSDRDRAFFPSKDALAWRVERLKNAM